MSKAQYTPLLYPAEKTEITGLTNLFAHEACDASGDIYIEEWGNQTPIIKLSSDGEVLAKLGLSSVPDPKLRHGRLQSFSIDPWGNLYILVSNWNSGKAFVVEFDDDGEYEQTIEVKAKGIFPYHIAVFPTHDFLLTGVHLGSTKVPKGSHQTNFFMGSFTSIFDPRGELVKEVSLSQDISKKKAFKDLGSNLSGSTSMDNAFAEAIGNGGAIAAPDGNVYLVRAGRPPLVYAISSNGEVIRRMVLHPPAPGLRAMLLGMGGGRLILSFQKAPSHTGTGIQLPAVTEYYSLYDTQTGKNVIDYKLSPELRGAFVCATGNSFIFISKQDERMFLIHAEPR